MIGRIKTEIQSLGVKVGKANHARKHGAGPAEGLTLFLKGVPANVPVSSPYVATSPYSLQERNGNLFLFKNNMELTEATIPSVPRFYHLLTEDGKTYNQVALKHGRDCLATTVLQRCIHWRSGQKCQFCGIELSLRNHGTIERKTPEQLAVVTKAAWKLDGISHVVLTTGSTEADIDAVRCLSACTRAIKKAVRLPIHVQIEPPSDPDLLLELKAAGADTIGIHIETFDLATNPLSTGQTILLSLASILFSSL
jgi:radical SAM protein (TIGR04043 family)